MTFPSTSEIARVETAENVGQAASSMGAVLSGRHGRYRLLEELGSGGFGTAMLAEGLDGQGRVVVKRPSIDEGCTHLDTALRLNLTHSTFLWEAIGTQGTADLGCVARVIDFGMETRRLDGVEVPSLFLVQEYVEGERLDEYVARRFPDGTCASRFAGVYEPGAFFDLAEMLAQNLAELHKRGVVHGDLWHRNVMVRDGSGELVFIDFGSSHRLDWSYARRGNDSYAQHRYCAPERLLSDREWSVGADVYSLGGLLYYLATGWDPPAPVQDIDELKTQVADMIRASNPVLYRASCGIADVIARCLRCGEQDRTPDADALLEDLVTFSPVRHVANPSEDPEPTSGHALVSEIAELRTSRARRDLEPTASGTIELRGSRRDIVNGFTRLMGLLDRGDAYFDLTVPTFWRCDNFGSNGGFVSMNQQVARRGVEIRRVFLLAPDEEDQPEVRTVLRSHLDAAMELEESGVGPADSKLGAGGFFTGVKLVDGLASAGVLHSTRHFALIRKGEEVAVVCTHYSERTGSIVSMRVWQPNERELAGRLKSVAEVLDDARPITQHVGLA